MDRLTTDNPKNNLESALNLFYAKDGEAWIRGGGPEPNYDDVTLFVFIRRVIKALLQNTDHVDELENDTLSEIMFDWLQDGPESIPGVIALLYESAWAFAEIRARLAAFEDLEMTPEAIENQLQNFSSFLMEMTGGRMSKTNYTVQAMVSEANDYQQKELEEAEQKAYDLGVDSVLRNHFDIPWDEAADIRKNIDHLRELLVAEKEGRMIVHPGKELCAKQGDYIYIIDDGEVVEAILCIVGFDEEGNDYMVAIYGQPGDDDYEGFNPRFSDVGKTLFFTREAAEAALSKMEEDEQHG